MRNEGGGFAEIDDEVAAVLAFVISSATFLAAQDDETGRCPKVVCKSLITRGSQSLIPNPCFQTFGNTLFPYRHFERKREIFLAGR